MNVVVTGAGGFVMSVFVAALLDAYPQARVTALDVAPVDELAERFLGERMPRIRAVRVDVRDAAAVRAAIGPGVDAVVHAATVTHAPASERDAPGRYLDVNVGGTVAVLDAVRAVAPPPRLLYLSSGAVYGTSGPSPRTEDVPPAPVETYGISKATAEQVVRRYRELFGVRAVVARPAKVFGAMERPTGARTVMSAPYLLAGAAVRGEPLPVTARTLDAACDWVCVHDVADALLALLRQERTDGGTYNVASGTRTPFRALADVAERWCGRPVVEVVDDGGARLDLDPAKCRGKDDAYAVDRIVAATGWRPHPVAERFAAYLDWAAAHESMFRR